MKTATLKELDLEGMEDVCGFPIGYVVLEGERGCYICYVHEDTPHCKGFFGYVEWHSPLKSYQIGYYEGDDLPPPLQGVAPIDSLIKVVKDHPLNVDNLKKCILTLVSSNSNWGMSMSEEDETFVSDILKRIEGEDE